MSHDRLPLAIAGSLPGTRPRRDTRFRAFELRPALPGEALVERTKIDDDSLVGPVADLLLAVAGRHFEVDPSSLDVDHLGRRRYVAADRRGREVSYVYGGADCAFTHLQ